MSNREPAVSIVMSVYNDAEHVHQTLASILTQEAVSLELIVIDDGSTDGSGDILERCAAVDQRVRVIHQANEGLTKALVKGCGVARADLIARHDCGDSSASRRLAQQAALFDACASLAFVGCATEFMGPEGEHLYTLRPTGMARTPTRVLAGVADCVMTDGPTHHGSVMFRRRDYERVGGYRGAFYYGQDWDLWYRLADVGTYQGLDQVLYIARIHPESISSVARGPQRVLARLSREALQARRRGESDAEVLTRAGEVERCVGKSSWQRGLGLYFIGEALRRNGDARARRYFRAAIGVAPLLAKAWVRYVQSLANRGTT